MRWEGEENKNKKMKCRNKGWRKVVVAEITNFGVGIDKFALEAVEPLFLTFLEENVMVENFHS